MRSDLEILSEAEVQALIAVLEFSRADEMPSPSSSEIAPRGSPDLLAGPGSGDPDRARSSHVSPESLADFTDYFGRYRVDWTDALADLVADGLLVRGGQGYTLTALGRERAEGLCQERPPMWYWYNSYYEATLTSRAYATFCERVFGKNFAQHGFSDMAQLGKLLEVTALGYRVWDFIAEDYAHAQRKKRVAEELRAEYVSYAT